MKLKLEHLQVQSFITAKTPELSTIKGGTGTNNTLETGACDTGQPCITLDPSECNTNEVDCTTHGTGYVSITRQPVKPPKPPLG